MPAYITRRRSKSGIRAAFASALLALALTSATNTSAQKPMCHAMGTRELTSPDKLPAPEKITGVGNVHLKITATPEAQTWFDQGLNLYHDFWDYESARAFQQSIRVDPNCAMCQWGLYLALSMRSPGDPYAAEALKKAPSSKRTPPKTNASTSRPRTQAQRNIGHEAGPTAMKTPARSKRFANSSSNSPATRTRAFFLPGPWTMGTTTTANRRKAPRKRCRCSRRF